MPYRTQHACVVDENITDIVEVRSKKTQWGILKIVYGTNIAGKLAVRSLRIPGMVPVQQAKSLCIARGGKFNPATPLNPQRQLLSEMNLLSPCNKKEIFRSLIQDFEMPFKEIAMSDWSEAKENELPDSAFIVVLSGGQKDETGRTVPRSLRLLPYKNEDGKIDKRHLRNALSNVHRINAPAAVKRKALTKLARTAKSLGMPIEDVGKFFKLSDLDFYLGQLEELEEE